MRTVKSDKNYVHVEHPDTQGEVMSLISESSAVGPYPDAMNNPGSSFLRVGERIMLNREEVAELVERMQFWLKYRRLKMDDERTNGQT